MSEINIIEKIQEQQVDFVDFWFVDIFGELHSVGIPSYSLTEDHFKNGLEKLDASSIRGFKSVNRSDMILLPDVTTFRILPPDYDDNKRKNARVFVELYEISDSAHQRYNRDSRVISTKATNELKNFELTKAVWGPELEFFIFDKINLFPSSIGAIQPYGGSGYSIESSEAPWTRSASRIDLKGGYYPAQPKDTLESIRKDICDDLYKYFQIKVEAQHHEVATSGQCEINLLHDETIIAADNVVTAKNLVKVKSKKNGKVATFMPKPIYGDNASAMHMHQSIWNKKNNMMYDPNDKVAEISQLCRYYVGGLLDHADALCAISNPTTNSYKRLVPDFEAPVNVCWGIGNRSSAVRIPMYSRGNEKSKRVEYRVPDPTANIYLLEAALLLAGLDGIRNKKDPGDPVEESIYRLTSEQKRNYKIRSLPRTLKDALESLKSDQKFLEHVFTKDFLDTYISMKCVEYDAFAQTPTPWEVSMYIDV
ncbi:MAG: type I glutamate--ammonia ligase [Thaumarchaeota archaeon]|nr:type I glutamate--ammonia ligase [Nitrososphaerota archaeon]MDE1877723.1 type I glutamate--ammonia ligase [Nitrososphaerota archaeon]